MNHNTKKYVLISILLFSMLSLFYCGGTCLKEGHANMGEQEVYRSYGGSSGYMNDLIGETLAQERGEQYVSDNHSHPYDQQFIQEMQNKFNNNQSLTSDEMRKLSSMALPESTSNHNLNSYTNDSGYNIYRNSKDYFISPQENNKKRKFPFFNFSSMFSKSSPNSSPNSSPVDSVGTFSFNSSPFQSLEENKNKTIFDPNTQSLVNQKTYFDSLPQGISKSNIPFGDEDKYILKSSVVPPVCPVCPNICPKDKEECGPCPACPRCPKPDVECKKVVNYESTNSKKIPMPWLTDFSEFDDMNN